MSASRIACALPPLAEPSFQFDTAAALADAWAPLPPAPHSLAWTLAELRRCGATLALTSTGVRLIHAHRLPALAEAVRLHDGPLRVWSRLGDALPAPDWDDETRLYAGWLARWRPLPATPFKLRPGVTVTDPARFEAGLAARLALPPTDAAGGLRADLRRLYTLFGADAERLRQPETPIARAA